jgi:hypothetical protein
VAAAVAREIELLGPEKKGSALAELCLSLARDLDTASYGTSHASQARELRLALGALHSGTQPPTGRLALVTQMADRSSPSTPESPA